jgi:hypothetical protein
MFDIGAADQSRFYAYGPSALPSELDEEVGLFVGNLLAHGPEAVRSAIIQRSDQGCGVLQAFAERMASLAVRRNDRALLTRALVAIVVGGLITHREAIMHREALLVVPLIDNSARRLGFDRVSLFDGASLVLGEPGSVVLAQLLRRPPHDISEMRFEESADEGGFRYLFNP